MIENLKRIADEIANSRVRLSRPMQGKQDRQDIIDEAKRLENLERDLRKYVSELQDKIQGLLQ